MTEIKWDELLQLAKEKGITALQLRWMLDIFKPDNSLHGVVDDGWISVEDDSELIDGEQYIVELGYRSSNTCTIAALYENGKFYNLEEKEHEFKNVIYYQPLPKPKTEQKFPF